MDWKEAVEIGRAHYGSRGVPISADPYDVFTDGNVFILSRVVPVDDDMIITVNRKTRAIAEVLYHPWEANPFPNARPILDDDEEAALTAA